MRFKLILVAAVGAIGLALAAACGDGDSTGEPPPETSPPPVSSGGSVAPNVFMTFEGRRYMAVNVGTYLVSRDQVELAGATDVIDIDHTGPVEVYRLKDGSAETLYTFVPGRAVPREEGGATADVWLEWAPAQQTTPGGPPDQPVSATPVPGPGSQPDLSVPVAAARSHLAQRLGLGTDDIEVVSVEEVDWPDACLGAAAPGEACAQVITRGFRVVLEAEGSRYVYHTDAGSHVRPAP